MPGARQWEIGLVSPRRRDRGGRSGALTRVRFGSTSGQAQYSTRRPRGFTLIEILMAMLIFAIGAVALLIMFLMSHKSSIEAADLTRARQIAEDLRAALEASLQAPMPAEKVGEAGAGPKLIYPFAMPFASLDDFSRSGWDRVTVSAETLRKNDVWFFRLPEDPYTGLGGQSPDGAITVLPKELVDIHGNPRTPPESGRPVPKVWYCKPTELTLQEGRDTGTVSLDDRDVYSFNVIVRRSTARSDRPAPERPMERDLLRGLYVAEVRVFKGYDPDSPNTPILEMSMTFTAPE